MIRPSYRRVVVALVLAGAALGRASAQTDLDGFMREVLLKRDDNWKKLQQYVLDEREQFAVNGPDKLPIWGERREYTWYIRDGFFVRSPVKFNGVAVTEADRRTYEADYLKRAREMDKRRGRGQRPADPAIAGRGSGGGTAGGDLSTPESVEGFITQSRQPEFVSSAYFLRFKFEEGKYALVGRETLGGREVLRIEYYPARLFSGTDRRRSDRRAGDPGKDNDAQRARDRAYDAEFQRMMNKVALVTLWVEPKAHQIVKYHFQNLPFDFLPGSWLLHVDDLDATMTMGQPFAERDDVWLPQNLHFLFQLTVAIGAIDARYDVDYYDYKQADVTTKVKIR